MRNVTLFILCAIFVAACSNKKKEEARVESQPVKVITISENCGKSTRSYVGTIHESYGSALSFATMGTVVRVLVDEGQHVRRGQLLAVLDATSAQSAYDMAKSTLVRAKDAFWRLDKLYKKGSLPEIKYIEVQTKLAEAQSAERLARKQLHDCRLLAPFDGYISQRAIDMGMNVVPGVICFKLVKLNPIEMHISVPENEVAGIKTGQSIEFNIAALGDKHYVAKITSKGIQANILSHTYEVIATLSNPKNEILPGMICNAVLPSSNMQQEIVVPQEAVMVDGEQHFVWIARGNKASRQDIQQVGINNKGVIVSGGLTVGDRVIVSGQDKVSEGTNIKVQ